MERAEIVRQEAVRAEDLLTTEARDVLRAAARADLQEITTEDR